MRDGDNIDRFVKGYWGF